MPGSLEALDIGGVQVPYYFRCPISLELMCDPVTVSTGQTYDRVSIESWVATGNTTCPVTREPLSDFTLIPNHTLRRLIQDWCVTNRSLGVERIPTPKQPADPTLVRSLLTQASTESLPHHSRLSSLRRLGGLARDSDKNRSIIISSHGNARNILISIIFSSTSEELTHESLALLVMFPLSESECESIASEPDRISSLASLLSHSSIEVRVNTAALIEIVLNGTRSLELRFQIGNAQGIFEGITTILNDSPIGYSRALKVGIKALFALSLVKQNRQKAVSAGAVEAIIDRFAEFEKCDTERALAIVELLCRIPAGCAAFARYASTMVPLLVKVILKVSERATEYAAGALLCLCSVSEELQRVAVGVGVVTQLLLLVQSDCTERAKRKAQVLLKLLRDSWPDDLTGNSNDFGCSDVVPF